MARPRKSNPLGLPAHVSIRNGTFYYQHGIERGRKLENLGKDMQAALKKAEAYRKASVAPQGTVAFWLDRFIEHCESRVGKPRSERGLSRRTVDDYKQYVEMLKSALGHNNVAALTSEDVTKYLEAMVKAKRAVVANREKACLSAAYTWFRGRESETGVKDNVVMGVPRNPEQKKETYVETREMELMLDYLRKIAATKSNSARPAKSVFALLQFVNRTLQRPEDILTWTYRNVKMTPEGVLVLKFRPGKYEGRTDVELQVEITQEIRDIFSFLKVDVTDDVALKALQALDFPIIHTRDGDRYTYDGISSSFKRFRKKVLASKEGAEMQKWSIYDMKSKGATDMAEMRPLTEVQYLCGHASITTTEIYVRNRKKRIAKPNQA